MQTKKCTSCKRELTYDQFSLDRRQQDGYSRWCKGCINWRRKRSYERAKKGTLHRPNRQEPLNEYNYRLLQKYLPGEGYAAEEHNIELHAKDVNSDMTYTLQLYKRNGGWTFAIVDNVHHNIVHQFYHNGGVTRDWLLSQSANLLVDIEIQIQE